MAQKLRLCDARLVASPRYLGGIGLMALWREALLAKAVWANGGLSASPATRAPTGYGSSLSPFA